FVSGLDVRKPLLHDAIAIALARDVAEHSGGALRRVVPAGAVERYVPIAGAGEVEGLIAEEIGVSQRFFRLLALGDVAEHDDRSDQPAVLVHRCRRILDGHRRAVLAPKYFVVDRSGFAVE